MYQSPPPLRYRVRMARPAQSDSRSPPLLLLRPVPPSVRRRRRSDSISRSVRLSPRWSNCTLLASIASSRCRLLLPHVWLRAINLGWRMQPDNLCRAAGWHSNWFETIDGGCLLCCIAVLFRRCLAALWVWYRRMIEISCSTYGKNTSLSP